MEQSKSLVNTHSESSDRSLTSYKKLEEKLGRPISPEQLSVQLARLNATFGEPRDRTPEMARLMANEWFRALESYGCDVVRDAVSHAIKTSKWWPALSEIREYCEKETYDWKDIYGLVRKSPHLADWTGVGDQLTEEEIIAKRKADCQKWRKEFNFEPEPIIDQVASWKPASQEMRVSEHLRRTCAVRRSLGLTTCGENCAKQNCELREREESR